MALTIKDEVADRLARELVDATGETLTRAVSVALEERLVRIRGSSRGRDLVEELDEIGLRCAALPIIDERSAEEIIGFDERGLPG